MSVYLDCYEALGYFGGPHWEIYPNEIGNNERFAIDDIDSMLAAIAQVKNGYET